MSREALKDSNSKLVTLITYIGASSIIILLFLIPT